MIGHMDSYKIKIDEIGSNEWERCAQFFADYTIYQTIPYQENRADMDGQELSRAIVYNDTGSPVLMCQVRIKRILFKGLAVGYVQRGPLIRSHDNQLLCSVEALRTLVNAYRQKGLNILRITPNVPEDKLGEHLKKMLTLAGFKKVSTAAPYRTYIISVDDSEEGIRQRLRKSFRRDLRKAEKAELICHVTHDESYCAALESLYEGLLKRKEFKGLSTEEFNIPQKTLSDSEKQTFNVVLQDEQPVSILLSSNLGDTGVVLLAASNHQGLKLGSAYLVWYRAAVSAHEAGMKWLDLGGIDPENNPTVAQFKGRMGGQETCHIGTFDYCSNGFVRVLWAGLSRVWSLLKDS